MTRLTAAQAKQLAGPTVTEKVDAILVAIKAAADNRKRELRTGWEYKDDNDLWVSGGYGPTADWKEAQRQLQELGYTVEFYYKETQFVDMYTIIKW
jgi:hypothetical protein